MDPSPDEVAGVVDLFGALTAAEIERAFTDIAARQGTSIDQNRLRDLIETAEAEYYLVRLEDGEPDRYVPGPAALPTLPEHGEDLPHMMDVEPVTIDRSTIGRAVEERLRADAASAVADEDIDRMTTLLDVAYEVDAWGVDTSEIRDRLSAAMG